MHELTEKLFPDPRHQVVAGHSREWMDETVVSWLKQKAEEIYRLGGPAEHWVSKSDVRNILIPEDKPQASEWCHHMKPSKSDVAEGYFFDSGFLSTDMKYCVGAIFKFCPICAAPRPAKQEPAPRRIEKLSLDLLSPPGNVIVGKINELVDEVNRLREENHGQARDSR